MSNKFIKLLAVLVLLNLAGCDTKSSSSTQSTTSMVGPDQSEASRSLEEKPTCANTTTDLTKIIREQFSVDVQKIQFTWSNVVTTGIRPDVHGLDCEATLNLALESYTAKVVAVAYELLPLADGSGSRLSIANGEPLQAVQALINRRNEDIETKKQAEIEKTYQETMDKLGPLFGRYQNERSHIDINYPPYELSVTIDTPGRQFPLRATMSDARTMHAEGFDCRLDIHIEEFGHSVRIQNSPGAACPEEVNNLLFTK